MCVCTPHPANAMHSNLSVTTLPRFRKRATLIRRRSNAAVEIRDDGGRFCPVRSGHATFRTRLWFAAPAGPCTAGQPRSLLPNGTDLMTGLLVHEWIEPSGGAENVLEAMSRTF